MTDRLEEIKRGYKWSPPEQRDSAGVTMYQEKADMWFLLDRLYEVEKELEKVMSDKQYIENFDLLSEGEIKNERIEELEAENAKLKDCVDGLTNNLDAAGKRTEEIARERDELRNKSLDLGELEDESKDRLENIKEHRSWADRWRLGDRYQNDVDWLIAEVEKLREALYFPPSEGSLTTEIERLTKERDEWREKLGEYSRSWERTEKNLEAELETVKKSKGIWMDQWQRSQAENVSLVDTNNKLAHENENRLKEIKDLKGGYSGNILKENTSLKQKLEASGKR